MAVSGLPGSAQSGTGFYWGGKGTGNRRRTVQRNVTGKGPGLITIEARDVRDKAAKYRNTTTGRFASADQARATFAAQRLQELMVAQRQQGSVQSRRSVSTQRLDRALLSRQNRVVGQRNGVFIFGVGVPSFLNSPESGAQYWRAIEEGTSFFVGRRLTGVFGATADEVGAGGRPFSPFGANRAGTFVPLRARAARAALRAEGYEGREANRVSGIIRRPIRAQHYMRKAWQKWDGRTVARELSALLTNEILSGFGIRRT